MENEKDEECGNLLGIDYYAALGLNRGCTNEDIRKAFRRLSLRYHPERLTSNVRVSGTCDAQHSAFAIIAEAYEVLSNHLYRAIYDQFGEAKLKKKFRGPDGCVPPYVFHGEPLQTYREFFGTENPYADILDNLRSPVPLEDCPEAPIKKKDEPIIKALPLTLNEVFYGGIKKMKIQRIVLVGENNKETAPSTALEEKILSIPIMPGMPPGAKIVFPEEGDQGPTKIPADVIFMTEDKPHETFKREGSDLRMTVKVALSEALTGTIVTVNTIDERILRVPITSVISPKYVKTISGEGLPLVEDPERRGKLIIDFDVQFPEYLPPSNKKYVQMALATEQEGAGDNDANIEGNKRLVHRMLLDGKMYTSCRH
ncbi:PREDICTED: dnaJ homolog subfamily B member 13-like [Ceratosolen solmsi marchali]|uniref:DnaJ homolog subfamily B member 13-like n=1 Tax=Ceratosolen solmsi marchali TaxID=326594 RepID=A0AAJ6YL69_9HYME|nr:PREDICTED: dnaJ homolog subfamily B member 13-like [Ceratosolen solmsi marchali]